MRTLTLICLLFGWAFSFAQPNREAIHRMVDTYEFGQQKDQPPVSSMVDGEHTTFQEGSFLQKGREEYLVQLLLVRGDFKKQFAFVSFVDESGAWKRSDWFVYGYTSLDKTDIESDGINELIHRVNLPGVGKNQQRYRLISLLNDVDTEIYQVDGFSTNANYYVRAEAGDHMSRVFAVDLIDTDDDGIKEISETITDEYFQFQYDNTAQDQVSDEVHETNREGYQRKTTIYRVKRGNLEVLEVK